MNSPLGTVVVTGGAGFIGSALARSLASSASTWIALDNLHPQVHADGGPPADLPPCVELIVGDVTDPTVWDSLLADVRPDVIIHLAAETGTAQSLNEATRHAHVNVVGTTTMLDALGRAGHLPAHLVLSSSRAVYGEGQWRGADGEVFAPGPRGHAQLEAGRWDFEGAVSIPSSASTTPPSPTSVYGATKLAQENVLRAWAASHDVGLTILRLQNVYGPGQSLINSYTGIVSLFSQWARAGKSIPVYEDGLITRDFVFIEDVVTAFAEVVRRGPRGWGTTLDVGSGLGTTILELARTIAAFHSAPEPHVTGQYRDGDVRHAHCSIDETLAALEWRPEWSVERGVAALQAWIAAQGAPRDVQARPHDS